MLDVLQPIADACDLTIPDEHKRPIAIIGAGAIVEYAHLPAYRRAGLPVAGIYDVNRERAEALAKEYAIERVHADVGDLLADGSTEVVDIAVVPWAQPDLARQALAAGKHLLCQKPLSLDLPTAQELVDRAKAVGVKLAVNQQLRFDEGLAAAREMVRRGWIGTPTAMTMTVNISTDWSAWPWLVESDRLEVMYHSIHYLDAIRSILGDPVRVFAAGGRTPGQQPKAETRSISTLLFADGTRAVVHVNHENFAGDVEATFRLDGSEGAIKGTLGLLYDYPNGRPDTLSVFSRTLPTDGWIPYPVTTRWLPDAFAGPMRSLLHAIATGDTPATDGEDNLQTLRLVHALYRSMDTGDSQLLEGVTS